MTEYLLSFVEEMIMNLDYQGYKAGRVEVHYKDDQPHHEKEEIRFFTDRADEWWEFQDKWDLETIDDDKLDEIRDIIKRNFDIHSDKYEQ